MKSDASSTAILVFSRAAREEASVKNFSGHPNPGVNLSIAHKLIDRTLRVAKKTRLQVLTAYSTEQKGNSFEQRLKNAIQQVFDQGFEKVITVGTDCPGITTELLLKANNHLSENDLVLGPSLDGGVYLIAMNKKAFSHQRFLSLKWLSCDLIQSFKSYAQSESLSLHFLKAKIDIDNAADFLKAIELMPIRSKWVALLRKIIALFPKKVRKKHIVIPAGIYPSTRPIRPPPTIA